MGKYTVKESGNNGSVEVRKDKVVRSFKKRLRRDEKDEIPIERVVSVSLDRQMGGDVVTVRTKDTAYNWKLKDADAMALVQDIERARK